MSVRVALVGAGGVAVAHARAIQETPGLKLSAVVSADLRRSRALLEAVEAPNAIAVTDLDDALAEGVDLVGVCVESGRHADVASRVLDAGVHVVIEKPLDASLARARGLATRYGQSTGGPIAAVVSQRRLGDGLPELRARLAATRIAGAFWSAPWRREASYYTGRPWRGTWRADGGGALMNQGVHLVDLMLAVFGSPESIGGKTSRLRHLGIEAEDTGTLVAEYPGWLATVLVSTAIASGSAWRARFQTIDGELLYEDDQLRSEPMMGVGPAAFPDPTRWTSSSPAGLHREHRRVYADVLAAILGEHAPAAGLADGFRAVAAVKSVYIAERLGHPVEFEAVLRGDFDDLDPSAPVPFSQTRGTTI
ncbi:MAG TPA: Gfo/Idh/MocA family oxidoreductase [Pseudolysinimonas sp.]|nr:Gfo/Idh/MocA family oxidoreductase [Pseudolysinimonas sp.]